VVDTEGTFYFFRQKKYGLEGLSYATVGGFINVAENESGFEACRREVMEEVRRSEGRLGGGLFSATIITNHISLTVSFLTAAHSSPLQMGMTSSYHLQSLESSTPYDPSNDPSWIPLGRYRTASNRGGGFLTSYLLKSAVVIPEKFHAEVGYEGLGTGSGVVNNKERGNADGEAQELVEMTKDEAKRRLLEGGEGGRSEGRLERSDS
jgi:hypothetical protein